MVLSKFIWTQGNKYKLSSGDSSQCTVNVTEDEIINSCSCPDFEEHELPCKHAYGASIFLLAYSYLTSKRRLSFGVYCSCYCLSLEVKSASLCTILLSSPFLPEDVKIFTICAFFSQAFYIMFILVMLSPGILLVGYTLISESAWFFIVI